MVTPYFELEIRPASDFCQLAGFCCGLEEMDNFIHSRLATCDIDCKSFNDRIPLLVAWF